MIDAAMAQLVEHILGKDEVPGPNPGSSSRQPRGLHLGALVFYTALRPLLRRVVRSYYSQFRIGASLPCFRFQMRRHLNSKERRDVCGSKQQSCVYSNHVASPPQKSFDNRTVFIVF